MKPLAQHLLLIVVGTISLSGCNRQDPDRLEAVARKVGEKGRQGLNRANDRLTLRWEEGDASADTDSASIEVRVQARLRWDKELAGTKIRAKAQGSTVELHGSLATAEQRQHAVQLAKSTVGVDLVVDRLSLDEKN